MGKHAARRAPEAQPHLVPVCHACGWDFAKDNHERREYDPKDQPGKKRTEPRTQINLGSKAYCDVCYEINLFANGENTSNGPVADALYHRALRQARERKPLTEEERARNRVEVKAAIDELAKKWGLRP